MGISGAPWLDRSEREAEEAPTRALQIVGIAEGSTVADVGAGSGYFTERLARLVGPGGRVFATDIQQGMLDLMGLAYTHSGLATSVIAIDKQLTKQALVPHGIPMPGGRIVTREELA